MLTGRFVSGVGAGFAIVFVPLYINQISPVQLRGFFGSLCQVSVNAGILLTQVLAIRWANDENWRLILSTAAVLGLITLVLVIVVLDESPNWLILNKHDEAAGFSILMKLRNNDRSACEMEIELWKQEKKRHLDLIESNPQLKNLNFYNYLTDPNYANSRKVATFSMLGQQFAGINSIIFYGVKILNGMFPEASILINCMVSVSNMIITFIASLFLDRLGRIPLLLTSLGLMGFASIGLSVGVLFDNSALTVLMKCHKLKLKIWLKVGQLIATGPVCLSLAQYFLL
ncbi:unnamed protein product [Ambrosiozyma monospora]|uniref:Unnamed protein product n=1 Tax=Ambrosiozyma monospora TaxID=43982 RepID=A0ACB5TSG8_AMBMO|nr:unnamed protein product [Ambrosiozyma monospora]